MKALARASLEAVIENWLDENCEENWFEFGWIPPNLAEIMATAAGSVLIANKAATRATEEANGIAEKARLTS